MFLTSAYGLRFVGSCPPVSPLEGSQLAGLFGEEMEKAKSVPGLGLGQGVLS